MSDYAGLVATLQSMAEEPTVLSAYAMAGAMTQAATAIEELQRERDEVSQAFERMLNQGVGLEKRLHAAEALLAGERELLIALNKRWSDATTLLARQAPVVEAARAMNAWHIAHQEDAASEPLLLLRNVHHALAALDQGSEGGGGE